MAKIPNDNFILLDRECDNFMKKDRKRPVEDLNSQALKLLSQP